MTGTQPLTAELDSRFSAPDAEVASWARAEMLLSLAELYWLSTVRPDGRPHVTPLIAVWLDGCLYFCIGPAERKAQNLAKNTHCVVTTGCNSLHDGFDVTVEGGAVVVQNNHMLTRLAEAFKAKYGIEWHFDVSNGYFVHEGSRALVFEVKPAKVLGFAIGDYAQTRFLFAQDAE